MLRLVDNHDGWQSSSADSLARVNELLRSDHSYELVLLGSGFGIEERAQLSEIIQNRQLNTKLVDHFGGGSGLLYSEVMRALG
ncbi:response regulator receiver protein [Lewinellaceae bacterium SD302]|nr:response regulator receiver protein [Lewinellaceae bacterium SD302]